jgi:hypothetical protein
MDAWTLARLAGHSNIRQSMTYVHSSDRALHAAIDRMSVTGGDEIGDSEEIAQLDANGKLLAVDSQQKS